MSYSAAFTVDDEYTPTEVYTVTLKHTAGKKLGIMGQLFLWTHKIDDLLQEEFKGKFGFDIPDTLLELHDNLPEEFMDFLGFYSIEQILEEESRPTMMMPGLVPFGEESDGDRYCFYLPWKDETGRSPIGIWMQETNHFLPISFRMNTFLMWWMTKVTLDSIGGEDWDEIRKILELFKSSCGLDEFDFLLTPPVSLVNWHDNLMKYDPATAFSITFTAANQFSLLGFDASLDMLQNAENILPGFGASQIWQARLQAMSGNILEAHKAYWRHLNTPMFANGYHYWWHAGDLQIQGTSELEAINFIQNAQIKAPEHIRKSTKVRFLSENDVDDFDARMELFRIQEKEGNHKAALLELENAFFIQSWDDRTAREILEMLLCIYPEHDRMREAEQCRRALVKLRQSTSPVDF